MLPLFRKEVIDSQSSRKMGDVFLNSPLSFWTITLIIVFIIAGLTIFALFGEYARKERVIGTLIPSEGLVLISPQRAGTYQSIFVEPSAEIQYGEPLLKVREDNVLNKGSRLSATLLSQMQDDQARLQNQLDVIPNKYKLRHERFQTQQSALSSEAQKLNDQIKIQKRSVEIERDIFERLSSLRTEEAASGLEVSTAERSYLNAQQRLNTLKNNQINLWQEVKDINAQIGLLPIEQEETEAELKNQLSSLKQSMTRTNAQSEFVVTSPVSGTIATVTARAGQTANPQRNAISILPEGSRLQARLFVPTTSVGFVKPGQNVRLLYDAFPYQKFGSQSGTVTEVSKTVVRSSDLLNAPQISEPIFLVIVELDSQVINVSGESIPLQAGMTLSADLILEDRKIWEWAFEPFLGAVR